MNVEFSEKLTARFLVPCQRVDLHSMVEVIVFLLLPPPSKNK